MSSMTLTEFLLARIAEDEAVARATLDSFDPLDWGDSTEDFGAWRMQGPVDGPSGYGSLIVDPQRVLAECEAKRRIVEGMQPFGPIDDINAPEVFGLLALALRRPPGLRRDLATLSPRHAEHDRT